MKKNTKENLGGLFSIKFPYCHIFLVLEVSGGERDVGGVTWLFMPGGTSG